MGRVQGPIDTNKCIQEVRKLKKEGYTSKIIACMICDAYRKHNDNEYLTHLDRFVLGLRYSEFLAEGNTDEDYVLAETKRQEFLKVLGLKSEEINSLCLSIYGLH